jgi:hypothetical protein
MIRRRAAIATGIAAGALAASMLARHSKAQGAYPAGKPVRIVVPFCRRTTLISWSVVAQP